MLHKKLISTVTSFYFHSFIFWLPGTVHLVQLQVDGSINFVCLLLFLSAVTAIPLWPPQKLHTQCNKKMNV
uniref:Uncharacterized protein n=1 Tax=Ixodes ricinus TaxID=34613 RepID=A0A6B0TXQ4_IXORI